MSVVYGPKYEDIVEPVVAKIMDELDDMNIFNVIDQGDEDPSKVYEGLRASVFPGEDIIDSIGMAQLRHTFPVYVIITNFDESSAPSALRKKLAPVYDALMADITHDGTCWKCFPKIWHAGLMVWPSGQRMVGVLSKWEAVVMQKYTPPHV
jgi:hypothetical protein